MFLINNLGTSRILKHQPPEVLLNINSTQRTKKRLLLIKSMSASALPAEIWLNICKQLCLHCQCNKMPEFGFGNEKPDYSVPEDERSKSEYEQGKSALAALSLTSRDMRQISQPILHHCFYDDPSQRKTPKFLRTLVAQPQLAGCVRVLALPKERSTSGSEYPTRGDFEFWSSVSTRLGIPPPRWVSRVLTGDELTWVDDRSWVCVPPRFTEPREAVLMSFDGTRPDSRLQKDIYAPFSDFFEDLRLWQQFLLVALCSTSLTHLAVTRTYGSSQDSGGDFPDLLGPGQLSENCFAFPRLRVFSCINALFSNNFPAFLSRSKLLNQIAVKTIDWPRTSSTGLIVPTPLKNVRKLTLSCSPHHFGDILNLCNQVQDLEYHLGGRRGPPSATVNTAPYPWPPSIIQNIRRLCWTFDHPSGWEVLSHDGKNLFPPLSEFKNLEILEIDRVALQKGMRTLLGLDPYAPEEFSRQIPEFLPASIRVIHFSHGMPLIWSWSTLIIELEVLVAAKTTSLPMLSVVQIDEGTRISDEKTLAQAMKDLGVVRSMKDAGIELWFGWDGCMRLRPGGGMRPFLPGNLHGRRHLGSFPAAQNFFLED